MHDPMVVAHEIKLPIPKHQGQWSDRHYRGHRWGWTRRCFTDDANRPIEPWWKPSAWTLAIRGRVYGWRRFATIWHVEPNGADSGTVCKHYVRWQDDDGWHSDPRTAWRWHVHHWRIQIGPLQDLRARLFDRCAECGRKGRPNHSMQWHGKRLGWWKFRSREGLYHSECASLVHLRRQKTADEDMVRTIFAAYRVATDQSEVEALETLTGSRSQAMEFHQQRRLWMLLGYERGESYRLVKSERPS